MFFHKQSILPHTAIFLFNFWLQPCWSLLSGNVSLSLSVSVKIVQLHSPLTITGSGAHGPIVFDLTLDWEDLEMENHMSFGTDLIDLQHLEVDL